ncbi:hypothetical protein DSO57_1030145 [Entomophthora muscae]|uniref:Uncharacterized protein n=1 Tax=Entomophthora muscae TaxID=34485 RepID=A0ACC2S3A1_9FUNG|nr:hypothetical protein DSO57_1030145 [Entomophthora muscae]
MTRNQKILSNVGRGLGVLMFPVAAVSPMALSVFWITSASFSLLQNVMLRLSIVRRALKLPAIPAPTAAA